MNVFFDSSAMAKRYVLEPDSQRVDMLLESTATLGVSVICVSEVISALCRLRRERKLTRKKYQEARRALFEEIDDCSVIQVTEEVVRRSVELLEKWPLRSADSLHVAAAAEWRADLFVSVDARQCTAARGYGLKVEQLS